jgi:hypothetical protein
MSLGLFTLGDPSIAQVAPSDGGDTKKAPPKRTTTALGDRKVVPEAR